MKSLERIAEEIRYKIIKTSHISKIPHLASSLSCIDIMIFLYLRVLNIKKINDLKRDKFILSKGHAATALYSLFNYLNLISDEELINYAKPNSLLEEHPSHKLKGVEASTGSLGHGLPLACGLAIGSKLKKIENKHFVLVGDGECNEGTIWEAVMFASSNKLDNLYVYVDFNKWQATGKNEEIINLKNLNKKFESFGWDTLLINGNDYKSLEQSFKKLKKKSGKPKVYIANTIKRKGVSFMEDDNNWHYKIPDEIELNKAKKELKI